MALWNVGALRQTARNIEASEQTAELWSERTAMARAKTVSFRPVKVDPENRTRSGPTKKRNGVTVTHSVVLTKAKTAASCTSSPQALITRSPLPDSITVVGCTPEKLGRQVVIRIRAENRSDYVHLSVADLASGDLKPLATAFAESGHFGLAKGSNLRDAAEES